jgi:hypothetical protein
LKNRNAKLLKKANAKNKADIALTFVVVLVFSKLIPIIEINVMERNKKLPMLKINLFSVW